MQGIESLFFCTTIARLWHKNMPAMNMRHNRAESRHVQAGVFEGRGVNFRFKSGRRTWQAKITLPDMGSAAFIFDVIY